MIERTAVVLGVLGPVVSGTTAAQYVGRSGDFHHRLHLLFQVGDEPVDEQQYENPAQHAHHV